MSLSNEAYLCVRNWDTFQHYKDRSPPWIKLYNSLLSNYEFSCLQDASKAHLLGIWLLASQLGNRIPNDSTWIGKRINATEPVNLSLLIDMGFLSRTNDASNMLDGSKQDACPEGEGETEGETEERERQRMQKSPFSSPESLPLPQRVSNGNGHDPRDFETIKRMVLNLSQTMHSRDADTLHKIGGASRQLSLKQIRAAMKQLVADGSL